MDVSPTCRRVLQLSCVPGLGLKTFHKIYNVFDSVDALFGASFEQLEQIAWPPKVLDKVNGLILRQSAQVATGYETTVQNWLNERANGVRSVQRAMVCLEDEDYPAWLKAIPYPPPLLYLEGNISCLKMPSLAIVGSRKPSMKGLRHAYQFASDVSGRGFCIVSGLALGIDAAAHRGAVEQKSATIAVLATGVDVTYPLKHKGLAAQILDESGLLVSEMKLGTRAQPGNFPRRNRLVSGLSQGVLVVEAALKSGSLITARLALEQGREVFAIPGLIDSPLSKGCHQLIKSGAKLVESVDDIVDELANPLSAFGDLLPTIQSDSSVGVSSKGPKASEQERIESEATSTNPLDKNEREFLERMGMSVVSFDDLLSLFQLDSATLLQQLLDLELNGYLETVPGGYQRSKTVESLLVVAE